MNTLDLDVNVSKLIHSYPQDDVDIHWVIQRFMYT